jgi:hypothetical protein
LYKKKKKKWHFCSFKIVTQGVSLCQFHYSPIWFISCIFPLSTLVLFLLLFQLI